MLKACPNQKMPSSTMNIKGNTAAASAISAPRVSRAELSQIAGETGHQATILSFQRIP